ncbi:MAG: RluA family pseudouridine synthase [Deltaproteobacteria bacterium]|nr:RluA family pseudouridine synthase [Deltaproteobacteria bacterium]
MPTRSFEFTVATDEEGARLDQFLAGKDLPHSRSQIKRRIDSGEVRVNGVPARPARRLRAGDRVAFTPPPPAAAALRPEAIPLQVLHEDAYLIVIDKPAGLVVHPAAGHAAGTLVNALLHRCADLKGIGGEVRPGIVHRLDRDTSGVMVVAKDEPTLLDLQAQFKRHTLRRAYVALVDGSVAGAAGRFATLYGRHPRHRQRFTTRVTTGRPAVTNWRVLERLAGATLVEARLETGRTHQIRVHFREHGHPLVGDRVYGHPSRDADVRAVAAALGRQALHARLLGFRHPATGAELDFETPVPADLQAAIDGLRALTRR